ncbi:MAG: hypothetical protein HC828_03250 [Blastochloris sp.]|nr:hypothetical protein [Blastochloris sp.]
MNTKLGILAFFVVGLVGGLIVVVVTSGEPVSVVPTTASATGVTEQFGFSASYEALTRGQMITQSDAIFVGQVEDIAPAQWNQDSGEHWESDEASALLYHTIEVQVLRSIVDTLDLRDTVTVTVLGNSPMSTNETSSTIRSEAEHTMQIGEQYIFFVVERHLAWKSDTSNHEEKRPTIRFITGPSISYLKRLDTNTTNNTLDDETLFTAEDPNEPPLSIADIQRLREFPEPTPTIIATDNQ